MLRYYLDVKKTSCRKFLESMFVGFGFSEPFTGDFRIFKNAIRGYDIEEQWCTYKQQSYVNIARNWCEDNAIEFEE